MRTAEFVSPKHPDKMCDRISDTLLDKFLSKDRYNLPSGYVFDEETCDIVCIIDKDPPELTEEQLADGYNVEWSDELMDWEIKKIIL